MMKRTMLMIILLAGSNANAVRRQETMSAGAELAIRKDAEEKIKAIEKIKKRNPAATIRDLEDAIASAQAAINKLPGINTGLQGELKRAATQARGPILEENTANHEALLTKIQNNINATIKGFIKKTNDIYTEIIDENGNKIKIPHFKAIEANGDEINMSYSQLASYAANSVVWEQIMRQLPAYVKYSAKLLDAIIEKWISKLSKDEITKLKASDPIRFATIQNLLKSYYDSAKNVYITRPLNGIANAATRAEFHNAIKPIEDKIEEYKREVIKKGFTI